MQIQLLSTDEKATSIAALKRIGLWTATADNCEGKMSPQQMTYYKLTKPFIETETAEGQENY